MTFEIFYPCVPYSVNQGFGVNGAYYKAHGININGHNGLDLRAYHGQPIYAAHDGVAYFETDDSQGEGVILITNQACEYKGTQVFFKSIFWHMVDGQKEPRFKSPVLIYNQANKGNGMPVKRGDIIGYADSSGLSTGDHLHFGLKPIVPGNTGVDINQLDSTDIGIGNWRNVEQTNGYLGAINPVPYSNGRYANEVLDQLGPAERVAVIAAQKQAEGNTKLAAQLWAIVAVIKAFLGGR